MEWKQQYKEARDVLDQCLAESHWKPLPTVQSPEFQARLAEARHRHEEILRNNPRKQRCVYCERGLTMDMKHDDYHVQSNLLELTIEQRSQEEYFIIQNLIDSKPHWSADQICLRATAQVDRKIHRYKQRLMELSPDYVPETRILTIRESPLEYHHSDVLFCAICQSSLTLHLNDEDAWVYHNGVKIIFQSGKNRMLSCQICASSPFSPINHSESPISSTIKQPKSPRKKSLASGLTSSPRRSPT
jgi:hypothetical protein